MNLGEIKLDWDRKGYSAEQVIELQKLFTLRGGSDKAKIKAQRNIVRNMGFLSLPFSLNKKKF